MKTKRIVNCDILRIIAFLCVISVHCLSRLGFYEEFTIGPTMLSANIIRCLFMIGVPLFLIITGYLMGDRKKLDKKYCRKIISLIVTYLLCSIIYYTCYYLFLEKEEIFTFKDCFFGFLRFEGVPYAWYINLYICLFFIIPFLNILWDNIKSLKEKKTLLYILICLFILPTLINIYNFDELSWFLHPVSDNEYYQIMPNYLAGNGCIILYYYMGRYLKDYKLNVSKLKNIVLIVLFLIIFGIFNYYRNYNGVFVWDVFKGRFSFESFIISVLVANLVLNNTKFNIKSKFLNKAIIRVTSLIFGAFLLSAIFDMALCQYVVEHTMYLKQRIFYMIPLVLVIALLSLIASLFVDYIQRALIIVHSKVKR